jgi:hypothetical protein
VQKISEKSDEDAQSEDLELDIEVTKDPLDNSKFIVKKK